MIWIRMLTRAVQRTARVSRSFRLTTVFRFQSSLAGVFDIRLHTPAGIGGWKRKSTLRSGTDLNFIFTPAMVGALYISIREKYFPDYRTNYFNPADYSDLAKFLHKENVNPEKYLHYVFGILDYKRPLKPKSLVDPLLVSQFKQSTKEWSI